MGWAVIGGYALCVYFFLLGRIKGMGRYGSWAEGGFLVACLLFSGFYQFYPVGPFHWLFDLTHTVVPGLLIWALLRDAQRNFLSTVALGGIAFGSCLRAGDLFPSVVLGWVWLSYSAAIGGLLFVFVRSQQHRLTNRIRVWCYPFMALVLLMDYTVFVVAHYPVEWRNSQVTRWMFWMHLSCIGVFVVLFLFKTWYIHCSLKPQRSVR
jgi:hypothetical protein